MSHSFTRVIVCFSIYQWMVIWLCYTCTVRVPADCRHSIGRYSWVGYLIRKDMYASAHIIRIEWVQWALQLISRQAIGYSALRYAHICLLFSQPTRRIASIQEINLGIDKSSNKLILVSIIFGKFCNLEFIK